MRMQQLSGSFLGKEILHGQIAGAHIQENPILKLEQVPSPFNRMRGWAGLGFGVSPLFITRLTYAIARLHKYRG